MTTNTYKNYDRTAIELLERQVMIEVYRTRMNNALDEYSIALSTKEIPYSYEDGKEHCHAAIDFNVKLKYRKIKLEWNIRDLQLEIDYCQDMIDLFNKSLDKIISIYSK